MVQVQYGPLGVKLWFSGTSRGDSQFTEPLPPAQPNRAPEDHVTHHDEDTLFNNPRAAQEEKLREQFYVKEPMRPPDTLEEFLVKLILKKTFAAIDRREGGREKSMRRGKTEGEIDQLLRGAKDEEPDFICKMCNLVFASRKYYEVHKVTTDHLHVVKGFFPG